MGGVQLLVRTYAHADVSPFPYLGNGRTDCADIWYVVSDPLARFLYTKAEGGAQLHCTRAHPFSVFRKRLDVLR